MNLYLVRIKNDMQAYVVAETMDAAGRQMVEELRYQKYTTDLWPTEVKLIAEATSYASKNWLILPATLKNIMSDKHNVCDDTIAKQGDRIAALEEYIHELHANWDKSIADQMAEMLEEQIKQLRGNQNEANRVPV